MNTKTSILLLLTAATNLMPMVAADNRPPTILDTDYGSFIDDIFAVGLLLQSTDVLDPRLILTTAEHPDWSANCVSEQLARSDLGFDVPVAIGETLPPYSKRGTVCGIPGLVGFALKETCAKGSEELPPPIPNGVEHVAAMLEESDRTDWTYIAVGGQTSLQKLIIEHPGVISKIKNLVVMGGNWCTGFDAYPDVPAPTGETNIGCDMIAANFVLESAAKAAQQNQHFPAIHYVPVVTVQPLSGRDYMLIKDAASPSDPHYSKAAHATIDFYEAWSVASRADTGLLIHKEAMTFDPAYESTPQFDAVAVLIAMDIARGDAGSRTAQYEFANGVHFVTREEEALAEEHPEFFKGNPAKAAYTLWSGDEVSINDKLGRADKSNPISGKCQDLTQHHYDPSIVPPSSSNSNDPSTHPPSPVAIKVALGFVSDETEKDFFHEMALRISGRFSPTSSEKARDDSNPSDTPTTSAELDPTGTEQNVSTAATTSSASCSSTTPSMESSRDSGMATEEYS